MDTTQRTEQQRSADRRRRELLEAADRVVLRDGPQASMNAIAAEAGIHRFEAYALSDNVRIIRLLKKIGAFSYKSRRGVSEVVVEL